MFVVLLRFSDNKAAAGRLMESHKDWLRRGFEDGVFLLTGSLRPDGGGGIVARDTSRAALESRVNQDPFVTENVVSAEIVEIAPSRVDDRLSFLLG